MFHHGKQLLRLGGVTVKRSCIETIAQRVERVHPRQSAMESQCRSAGVRINEPAHKGGRRALGPGTGGMPEAECTRQSKSAASDASKAHQNVEQGADDVMGWLKDSEATKGMRGVMPVMG